MKYLLLIYTEEKAVSAVEREECYRESEELSHKLKEEGKYLAAAPLLPATTAMSVRVRGGKPLVTDGPFAETREQLGGYFLVEAANLDEAIEVAGRLPAARYGTVEVRQILEIPGLT